MSKPFDMMALPAGIVVLVVLASGCTSPGVSGGSQNKSSDHSWPKLFDTGNLSWYEYNMTNLTDGRTERQLTVRYSDDELSYQSDNGTKRSELTRKTSIRLIWLAEDRLYGADIDDNASDGKTVRLIVYMGDRRAPHSIAPLGPHASESDPGNNTWLIGARSLDLAGRFDVEKDRDLHVSGFDFLNFNDRVYYCSIYESDRDPDFRAWHNASFPAPLKIIANTSTFGSSINGVWTFELTGWG